MDVYPLSNQQNTLYPQEDVLEAGAPQKQFVIGIPKEVDKHENRIALTPESVEILAKNGHRVIIESNAGVGANYSNSDYNANGGIITHTTKDIYDSDIILKVTPLRIQEIEALKSRQIVFSSLRVEQRSHLESVVRKLMDKKTTAIAYDYLKDNYDSYPVVRLMSEIAGCAAIMIASEYLTNIHKGKGILLGGITGITPTEVVILGAGTAAENAAKTAISLGAIVKVFDNSLFKLRRLQNNIGQSIFTSVLHNKVLRKAIKSADVVIGAMRKPTHPAYILSEEMVGTMKNGAIIVDISLENGRCFETSRPTNHGEPVFVKHGVIHYCVPNIASRVARTASIALSNVLCPLIQQIALSGSVNQHIKDDIGFRHGVYIYNGILTSKTIGNSIGIASKDINLLMAAF